MQHTHVPLLLVTLFALTSLSHALTIRSETCPIVLPTPESVIKNTNGRSGGGAAAIPTVSSRIRNGDRYYSSSIVYLVHTSGKSCTGVLIDKEFVLSAAHCSISPSWTAVFVDNGDVSQELFRIRIKQVLNHPKYRQSDPESIEATAADIAVVILNNPAHDIPIVKLNIDDAIPRDWTYARAIGYGKTTSDNEPAGNARKALQYSVDIPILPRGQCNDAYSGITDRSLCVGYTNLSRCAANICDGGAGLFVYTKDKEPVHVGVLSQGMHCEKSTDVPMRFARTSKSIDWLVRERITFISANATDIRQVDAPRSGSSNTGAIVGGIIGGVLLLVIVLGVVVVCCSRKGKKAEQVAVENMDEEYGDRGASAHVYNDLPSAVS